MPNRILRDGLLTSTAVSLISEDAFAFYIRLCLIVANWSTCEVGLDIIRAEVHWGAVNDERLAQGLPQRTLGWNAAGDQIVMSTHRSKPRWRLQPTRKFGNAILLPPANPEEYTMGSGRSIPRAIAAAVARSIGSRTETRV
jgi:hypothetical protein